MGFGLGAAIGARVATGDPVILITGDGSFGMNLNELATAVTYNLNAKPALRFYLADGFSASDFAFSINGSAVAAEEGTDADGKIYVEVKLYAYELAETVDYTVNGESDSCHIKCYYEWAKTQNNDSLVKLVERFAKYCESAAAYRASVTK